MSDTDWSSLCCTFCTHLELSNIRVCLQISPRDSCNLQMLDSFAGADVDKRPDHELNLTTAQLSYTSK